MSRKMQNLTARYNYIYNSQTILHNHLLELVDTNPEDYDQILPTFIGPEIDISTIHAGLNLSSMNEIIRKAKIIILEKSFSNYTDDAYILLGKANFFNGNYFDAAEYFDYVIREFKANQCSYLEALDWKARSLVRLKRIAQAGSLRVTLDSIILKVKAKQLRAEPMATLAQLAIINNNDTEAIAYLNSAINFSRTKRDKIRWTYILAQLNERQGNLKDALANYRIVQKSNASFEMFFNAKLNEIEIKNPRNSNPAAREEQLLHLLKDDKNAEHLDQIYFSLAENYASAGTFDQASDHYLKSAQYSTMGRQKGLAYLRLANLYLNNSRDYRSAKTYFDSTINILPVSYPGYDLIAKKSANLEYLTERYDLIALQDTLQAIAALPEEFRMGRIQRLANPSNSPHASVIKHSTTNNRQQPALSNVSSANTFYFSNPSAISIGFSDFKRIWGNRKLEDNWRQSVKAASTETVQNIVNSAATPHDPDIITTTNPVQESLITKYTEALPLTPQMLAESSQNIIDAYYQIANFYFHELKDYREANSVYQKILDRYPDNNHRASIYYSLYLINKDRDPMRSAEFKRRVLTGFPNSDYAKAIADPDFSLKQSTLESYLFSEYNEIFNEYEQKNFKHVILKVDEALSRGDRHPLSAQLKYLKAIAVGRMQPVDSLLTELNGITKTSQQDSLITPLVISHINYINTNMDVFKGRKAALVDVDFNETPMANQPSLVPKSAMPLVKPSVPKKTSIPTDSQVAADSTANKTDGLFSTAPSTLYYFVIAVGDASLTLSSSRFGIGQFNRGTYPGSQLRHQLKEFDTDQLIYVGNFTNFDDVKSYATAITPQLKQIMKVPVNIYDSFIISKENFDKVVSEDLLDRYIEFYKKHF